MPDVLLIEDEEKIAETVVFAFEQEAFKVRWANQGQLGSSAFKAGSFDLVILDLGLPDISGFEIIKEIRVNDRIPIITLTARAEEIDKVLGLELGSDDYVTKPFSPRELVARAKALLRRTSSETKTRAQQNGFSIDEKKHRISCNGRALNLSKYEYEILQLLMKRPGWVFSREKIMNIIWEEPEESFERTVDAHIKSIRAKIKEISADSNVIVTHRGVGYSFTDSET